MNPEELDKQFEATDFDKSGNVIPPSTPPAAAKKKRTTVADLNKTMDELTELIDVNVFDWLEKLDTRVRHFENAEAEKPDSRIGELAVKLEILETTTAQHNTTLLSDVKRRLDALEDAIGAIADAFRQHLEEISGEQPAAAQEIEFAKPPVAIPVAGAETADIAAVASVCLTMNDVLLVTRALKDSPQLTDLERVEILNIACKSAGVDHTNGLQIRAGVQIVQA